MVCPSRGHRLQNILKEFKHDFSQFSEALNSNQAAWQNKAGGVWDKVNMVRTRKVCPD